MSKDCTVGFGRMFSDKELLNTSIINGCSHEFNREENKFCSVCGAKNFKKDIFYTFFYNLPESEDIAVVENGEYVFVGYILPIDETTGEISACENDLTELLSYYKENGFSFQEKDLRQYLFFW